MTKFYQNLMNCADPTSSAASSPPSPPWARRTWRRRTQCPHSRTEICENPTKLDEFPSKVGRVLLPLDDIPVGEILDAVAVVLPLHADSERQPLGRKEIRGQHFQPGGLSAFGLFPLARLALDDLDGLRGANGDLELGHKLEVAAAGDRGQLQSIS